MIYLRNVAHATFRFFMLSQWYCSPARLCGIVAITINCFLSVRFLLSALFIMIYDTIHFGEKVALPDKMLQKNLQASWKISTFAPEKVCIALASS